MGTPDLTPIPHAAQSLDWASAGSGRSGAAVGSPSQSWAAEEVAHRYAQRIMELEARSREAEERYERRLAELEARGTASARPQQRPQSTPVSAQVCLDRAFTNHESELSVCLSVSLSLSLSIYLSIYLSHPIHAPAPDSKAHWLALSSSCGLLSPGWLVFVSGPVSCVRLWHGPSSTTDSHIASRQACLSCHSILSWQWRLILVPVLFNSQRRRSTAVQSAARRSPASTGASAPAPSHRNPTSRSSSLVARAAASRAANNRAANSTASGQRRSAAASPCIVPWQRRPVVSQNIWGIPWRRFSTV